jgi:putative copper export protein
MRYLLYLHLLGASVWVGGHLILLCSVLPGALCRRDPQPVRAFEQLYERIGIPALLLQLVSGLWLATLWLPPDQWLGDTSGARLIQAKLLLLGLTAALGLHARLALIPRLDARRLPALALHIALLTAAALALAWVGSGFRFGGLFATY